MAATCYGRQINVCQFGSNMIGEGSRLGGGYVGRQVGRGSWLDAEEFEPLPTGLDVKCFGRNEVSHKVVYKTKAIAVRTSRHRGRTNL